jgi:uncharacterized membrane protein YfcA
MWTAFDAAILVASVVAGAIASVAGFGIGSVLTPIFALQVGAKTAVAAVSVAHFAGTAIRCWGLRAHIDRTVLWRFGLASAAGGLTGALLNASTSSPALAVVLGAILLFAGVSQVTGLSARWRFHGPFIWLAGVASGVFGGLVGNQGGIRSAAMLGLDLSKEQFVATATAIALCVDAARMPVYIVAGRQQVAAIWPLVLIATLGVVAGTVMGGRVMARVPERRFRQVVGVLVALLGIVMLVRAHA